MGTQRSYACMVLNGVNFTECFANVFCRVLFVCFLPAPAAGLVYCIVSYRWLVFTLLNSLILALV